MKGADGERIEHVLESLLVPPGPFQGDGQWSLAGELHQTSRLSPSEMSMANATDSLGVERELGGLGVQRSVVPVEDHILEVAVRDLSLLLADAEDFGVVGGAGQVAAREAKKRGSIPLVVVRRSGVSTCSRKC